MVDERQAAILRAVVKQYIDTSQPVSSSAVVGTNGVHASAATVRSEMLALERDGYLHQPHTSAGRVPTDRGYRFFVDQLDVPENLRQDQQQDVRSFFARASGELENMLQETGRLLSDLTGAAAVVVGPDHETTTVRSVQLITLGPRQALVVAVFSNGAVEKRSFELDGNTSDATMAAASVLLTHQLQNRSLGAINTLRASGNVKTDALASLALGLLHQRADDGIEHVHIGGASRLAVAFDAVETVRNVLTILEQQYVVVTLIRDLLDRGISVSIGTENNVESLARCSLVVAPTMLDGEQRGSVAVIGPTRMDYGQAMAAVAVVSRQLAKRLGDN